MIINGYELIKTCGELPEQYDVKKDGEQVAYLRLRGCFTVECPDVGGELVYQAEPEGDGIFKECERNVFLWLAIRAVDKWYGEHPWKH